MVVHRRDTMQTNPDYGYNAQDTFCYPLCCLCSRYSVFLFYVDSKAAMAMYLPFLEENCNIFCAECLPRESERDSPTAAPFYSAECLFNNNAFVSLFDGYSYSNPNYTLYDGLDRIIITESAKVNANYKTLLRNPLPKHVKVKRIQQLFPPVHRLPFRKYADKEEMFEALRRKFAEIRHSYLDVSTASLHDNIDMLVERTPLHERRPAQIRTTGGRIVGRSQGPAERSGNRFPSDALVVRDSTMSPGAMSEANSIVVSQQTINPESSDELPVDSLDVSSESVIRSLLVASSQETVVQPSEVTAVDISSQSLTSSLAVQPMSSESLTDVSIVPAVLLPLPDVSSSSVDSEVVPTTTRRNQIGRSTAVVHDSQEAGPSGLQHQQHRQHQQRGGESEPMPKRRRVAIPVNPSPENFDPTTIRHGSRMPRLPGG